MHTYGPETLGPVFHFLDELIRDQGDLLYMGLVYAAIPLIGWILCGGLRRKNSARQPHTSIIVIYPPERPPPPLHFERECDFPSDDDEDSFAA